MYHKAGTDTVTFAGVMLEGKAPSFVKYLVAPLFARKVNTILTRHSFLVSARKLTNYVRHEPAALFWKADVLK